MGAKLKKIFNKKTFLIIFAALLIESIPSFFGAGDPLIGFHSNSDYLASKERVDATGGIIKIRYIYFSIPQPVPAVMAYSNTTKSYRFAFG